MLRNRMLVNTIRVYREHVKAMESIIPVVESFDGKVINKRFETALNEVALPDGLKYYFSYRIEYGCFKISGYNSNRSFPNEPDDLGYCSYSYVDNECFNVRVDKVEETMNTDTGKLRIKSGIIIQKIYECMAYNTRLADELENAMNNQDDIRKEFQEVVNQLVAFNKKYSYNVRNKLGIYYDLEYRGDSACKDYSIKTY